MIYNEFKRRANFSFFKKNQFCIHTYSASMHFSRDIICTTGCIKIARKIGENFQLPKEV